MIKTIWHHVDIRTKDQNYASGTAECELSDYFDQVPSRILEGAWNCSAIIEWTADRHREEWRIVLEGYSLKGDELEQFPRGLIPFNSPSNILKSINRSLKERS